VFKYYCYYRVKVKGWETPLKKRKTEKIKLVFLLVPLFYCMQ
jgi:hypothetical protein